jgi:hypothetical protein
MPNDFGSASIYIRTRDGHEIHLCVGRPSCNRQDDLSVEEILSRNMDRIVAAKALSESTGK